MDDESSNSIPSISSNRNRSSTSNDQPTSPGCPLQKRKSIATTESLVTDNPTQKRRSLGLGGDKMQQSSQSSDDFKIFATFVASELRKIKDPAYAQATQRQMLKLLLERMENEPEIASAHCSSTGHWQNKSWATSGWGALLVFLIYIIIFDFRV